MLADYLPHRKTPQRKMFPFAGRDMENINGGGATALTITLMITCKLKTNLFIFSCWDSAVELEVSLPPLRQNEKYTKVFLLDVLLEYSYQTHQSLIFISTPLLLLIQNVIEKFKSA